MGLDSIYAGWLLLIECIVIVLYYALGDRYNDLWTVIFHSIQNGTISFTALGWIYFGKISRIAKLFVGAIFAYNLMLAVFWWLDLINVITSPVPVYVLTGLTLSIWAAILIYQIYLIRKRNNEFSN